MEEKIQGEILDQIEEILAFFNIIEEMPDETNIKNIKSIAKTYRKKLSELHSYVCVV